MQTKNKILIVLIIAELILMSFIGIKKIALSSVIYIMSFSNNQFIIKKGTPVKPEYMLINKEGKAVNNEKYHRIIPYKNFYIVKKNLKYGLVNAEGKTIIPVKYDSIKPSNEYFIAALKSKKGLINSEGKIVFPVRYDMIYITSENLILKKNKVYSIFDMNKKFLFSVNADKPPKYINNNRFLVVNNDRLIITDNKGNPVTKTEYQNVHKYFNIIKYADIDLIEVTKENKYGIINSDGSIIIPLIYEDISLTGFHEGVFNARKNGKWGLINLKNEVVVDFLYDYTINQLNNGFYMVKSPAKKLVNPKKINAPDKKTELTGKKKPIKPNHQERKNDKIQIYGDLHVVSVYEGKYKEPKEFAEHKSGEVTVRVSITDKPVTLLLSSYEPVKWTVKADKGVKINKIYFTGYYDGDVMPPSKTIPVEKLYKRFYIDNKKINKIIDFTDKLPVTAQYEYQMDYFFVDGKEGKVQTKPAVSNQSTEK